MIGTAIGPRPPPGSPSGCNLDSAGRKLTSAPLPPAAYSGQPCWRARPLATFLKTTEISIHGARTLPREYFVSPDVMAEEMEKIFLQRWLCVGREDRIPNPGDWFVQEVGRESVIVLRDKAGGYRAYFNVCRHRGTRLCEEHTGRFSETIQCPYHAWTWSLDGRLIGAPSTADIENFDKADWPLHQVGIAAWEGFLFLNLS